MKLGYSFPLCQNSLCVVVLKKKPNHADISRGLPEEHLHFGPLPLVPCLANISTCSSEYWDGCFCAGMILSIKICHLFWARLSFRAASHRMTTGSLHQSKLTLLRPRDCTLPTLLPHCPQDLELHYFTVITAKANTDLHILNRPFLVTEQQQIQLRITPAGPSNTFIKKLAPPPSRNLFDCLLPTSALPPDVSSSKGIGSVN